MNNKIVPHADTLKSRSRGISQDMSPDAINRRLDIVDELREFAFELRDSTRHGSLGKTLMTSDASDTPTLSNNTIDANDSRRLLESAGDQDAFRDS